MCVTACALYFKLGIKITNSIVIHIQNVPNLKIENNSIIIIITSFFSVLVL